MAEQTDRDPLLGRRLGEFIITEKFGEGGFGVVYLARQPILARDAIIKVLKNQETLDRDQIERFTREARLASRLEHPYTAHIYAFGVEPDGLLWIAMEIVNGTPLNQMLKKQGPVSLERFVPLLDKICEVVHTAHEVGIVHRDIKPANVMVIARAGRLLPKLLDFGIAKPVEITPSQKKEVLVAVADKTAGYSRLVQKNNSTTDNIDDSLDTNPTILQSNEIQTVMTPVQSNGILADGSFGESNTTPGIVGSPPYMAPEQWLNTHKVSARTDIYALAILCYEVLTGQKPFRGDLSELFRAHMFDSLPHLGASFPPALNEVLAKATAKNPEERYATAIEFAAHFRAAAGYSEDQPVVPRLEREVQEDVLARAPQPIAEAVAALAASRNLYQAREQVLEVVRALTRYIGVLALAAHASVEAGIERGQEPEGVRKLRIGGLTDLEWLELAEELILNYRDRRDAYPVPELVDYFVAGSTLFQKLIERSHARVSEQEEVWLLLSDSVRLLAKLLYSLSFLWQYRLVVVRGTQAEEWRGNRMRVALKCRQSDDGVYLLGEDDCALLSLQPLIQVAEPTAGSRSELFFFEGRGRRWARFLAIPAGFERSDDSFWDWYSSHIYAGDLNTDGPGIGEVAPYPGLRAFTAQDSDLFFGREREAEAFLNRMKVQPLLVVVGPSGAGKSSFLQAGVVPGLASDWKWLVIRPGSSPTSTLLAALRREFPGMEPGALAEHLSRQAGAGFLLIVDQFEEVLTLCLDQEDRRRFCQILLSLSRTAEEPIRVVLTLRDDFLVRARELPLLGERLSQGLELLTTPGTDDLIRILTEPARRVGYQFEDRDLPREIAESVAGKQGALPLVAFTASRLWEMRDRQFKLLRRKPYEAMGGVGGALAQHAEGMLKQMIQEERVLVRDIFRRLVTSEGTRAVMPRRELLQVLGGGATAEAALEKLVHARLLSASEGEGGIERVEVVHEALLAAWPRLVKWRQEDAEGARLRDQLQAAARQWDERGRPKGLLWRDEALVEYELWRARYPGRLTHVEEEFGRQSLDEAHRSKNTRKWLTIGFVFLLVFGFLILFWQRQKAVESENEARLQLLHLYVEQGRQELLAGNSDRALVFLSEAYRGGKDDPALRFMMHQAVADLDPVELPVLEGHADAVRDVAFNSSASLMATASADATTVLWSKGGVAGRVLRGHQGSVNSVVFSPDGQYVLTAGSDGDFRIWSLDGKCKLTVNAHIGPVNSASFSPDSRRVVTAGLDRVARVWSVFDGSQLAELTGHRSSVMSASFSPDGNWIVTAGHDWTVRIWESRTGKAIAEMAGHQAVVHSAVFSPDGLSILTAGGDGSVKVWNAANRKLLGSMDGHAGIVHRAIYNGDGTLIASCGADRTVKVWDSLSFKLLRSIPVNEFTVNALAFSADGSWLLVASGDQTARVLDVRLESRSPEEIANFVRDRLKLKLVGERLEPIQAKGEKRDDKQATASTSIYVAPLPADFLLNRYNFDVVRVDASGQIVERTTREARYYIEDLGNGVSMDMVAIPGGTFLMGSPESEQDREKEFEGPQHRVDVKPFFMSRFEVTQAQWKAVMGNNPSHFKGDDLPVDSVSWYDALEFCERLSEKTGKQYRLPTEAQWEYAARAGTDTPFHFGPTITPEIANYHGGYPYGSAPRGIFRERTTQVGVFGVANAFGLYDMHGNVVEWVMDGIHKGYDGAPTDARAWEQSRDSSDIRVLRGGSWGSYGYACRSAFRVRFTAATRYYLFGFRVVLSDTGWLGRAK